MIQYSPEFAAELQLTQGVDIVEKQSRFASCLEKMSVIRHAVAEDFSQSENKVKTIASLAGILAVEAVGATKAPSLLAIPTAIKIQKETGVPIAAGIGAGGLYGAWCYTAARTINNGASQLPQTFEAISKEIPSATKLPALLPGLDTTKDERLATRAGRGIATYSTGVMLYVAGAALQNQPAKSRKNLCKKLGQDGGLFLGILAVAATGAIMALEKTQPGIEDSVARYAGDTGLLFKSLIGLTALKCGYKWASKRVQAMRNRPPVLQPAEATS